MEGGEGTLGSISTSRGEDDEQSQLTADIDDDKELGIDHEEEEEEEEDDEEETSSLITMAAIKKRALVLAEVTFDEAFEIDADKHPLHLRIGEYTLIRLGEVLYEHIYKDTDLKVESAFKANLRGGKKEIEVLHVQRGVLQVGQIVQGESIPSLKNGADEDTFVVEVPEDGGQVGTYVLSQAVIGTKIHEDIQLGGFVYGPFRSLFKNRTREDMALEFTDFLTQRLGGENNYKHNHEDRGPALASSLLAIHHHIDIDIATAQRWLNHMDATLEDLEDDIDIETRRKLRNYFKYTAFFLVVCSQVNNEMIARKTYDYPMNEKYTNIYSNVGKNKSSNNSVVSSGNLGGSSGVASLSSHSHASSNHGQHHGKKK